MGTLRPKYLLYGYMEPLGREEAIVGVQGLNIFAVDLMKKPSVRVLLISAPLRLDLFFVVPAWDHPVIPKVGPPAGT